MSWIDKVHSVNGFTVDNYERWNESVDVDVKHGSLEFHTCINVDDMAAYITLEGYESSTLIATIEAACTYLDALGVEFRKGDTP